MFIVEGCGGASTGIIFTAEFLCVYEDVGSPHYAVHAMVGGDLLILNWSPKESVARGLDRNGRAVAVNSWQPLVFVPAINFKWVRRWAGSPPPSNGVVGGHLADGTPLYVVVTLAVSSKRPIGHYNPVTKMFSSYWGAVTRYNGYANFMVQV